MKNRPSKVSDVVWITVTLYAVFAVVCGILAAVLYWQEHQGPIDPKVPLVEWIYPAFALGMPVLVVITSWIIFIRETRYRRNDPYRFSRRQFRFVRIHNLNLSDLSQFIKSIGYTVSSEASSVGRHEIVAVRIGPNDLSLFKDKNFPTPHTLKITVIENDGISNVTCECFPTSRLAVSDFKNTIYDSLEELLDKLNWRERQVSHDQQNSG